MQHVEMLSLQPFHPDYFLQRFTSAPLTFQPGQFVMVKPSGSLDPFLPRAYSILRVGRPNGKQGVHAVEILYKIMGKGSTALSRLKPGDRVDLLGPLGHGYEITPGLTTALLVAGGIGVPPVVALAEHLAGSRFPIGGSRFTVHGSQRKKAGRRSSVIGRRNIVAFIGGKTSHDVLCLADLRKAGAKVHVATDDGSAGQRGLVSDLLEAYLASQADRQGSTIYACGPHAMLHAVARIAERFQVACQVSLEADMACGFGACMGCVIPVRISQFTVHGEEKSISYEASTTNERSYKLCCKDGPAFDAMEIAW